MKKKVFSLIALLLVTILMTAGVTRFPAYAAEFDSIIRVIDKAGILTESEINDLETLADEISNRQDMDVAIYTAKSSKNFDSVMTHAQNMFDYNGYGRRDDRSGVLLLLSMETREWWISTSGYGIYAFTDSGIAHIGEQISDDLTDGNYFDAFQTYLTCADDLINMANGGSPYDDGGFVIPLVDSSETSSETSAETQPETSTEASAETQPEISTEASAEDEKESGTAFSSRVVDKAGLLTESEISDLETLADEISDRQDMDIVIYTVPSSHNFDSVMAHADDLFDYNGYGRRDDRSGVLLLLSMEARDWWISTRGYGIYAFTDAGIQYIGEQMLKDLKNGNYHDAFRTYLTLADDFINQANEGHPYDVGSIPKEPFDWTKGILGSGIFSVILSWIITGTQKRKLKSVAPVRTANNYLRSSSMKMYGNREIFLYSHVSRTRKPERSSSSSSGGSSTHTSSSGATHGGGGGKF